MDAAQLAKVKSIIKPDDRIIMAKKDILPLKFPVEQWHEEGPKPIGLWYAIGTEWIDWVQAEMPHWLGDTFYKIEISNNSMLKIGTEEKLERFLARYGVSTPLIKYDPNPDKDLRINWLKVTQDYNGIEIAPFQKAFARKYIWYSGWDVASGCIWDKAGIKSIQRINID